MKDGPEWTCAERPRPLWKDTHRHFEPVRDELGVRRLLTTCPECGTTATVDRVEHELVWLMPHQRKEKKT